MGSPVVIRADVGPDVGAGHAMRCLALAQALIERERRAVFVLPPTLPWVCERLDEEGFERIDTRFLPGSVDDAAFTIRIADEQSADWIVLDGYCFGHDYQKKIVESGHSLAAIDDNAEAGAYAADLIINQNLHATEDLYDQRSSSSKLLLGPRFALLRKEFQSGLPRPRHVRVDAKHILVALGGGETSQGTRIALDALGALDDSDIEAIVLGTREVHPRSSARIRAAGIVSNMVELLSWADIALAASGSVSWELAYAGLPSISMTLADNQRAVGKSLTDAGISVGLGELDTLSPEIVARALSSLLADHQLRRKMSERGQELVDGHGAGRVACALTFDPHADSID